MLRQKKGQVWIETVVYTLIGLTVIGLLLAFAKPKIEEVRDKAILDQTKEALTSIDKTLSDIIIAPGNTRIVWIDLKKGDISIDAENDRIEFLLKETRLKYSEPNKNVSYGKLNLGEVMILTEPKNDLNNVKIWVDYSGMINLSYNHEEKRQTFQQASTPYKFSFKNEKTPNVDISLIS